MAWSFKEAEAAEKVIEDIKEGKISNSSTAYGLLCQIINDLPNSYVAEEAKELREKYN